MDKALAIQKEVQKILETEEVYLVGGSVRDLVMGNTPKDYDFTTPMLPEDVESKVKAAGRRVYAIGKKFGTIGFKVPYMVGNIEIEDKQPVDFVVKQGFEYVEVTTFRSEIYIPKSRKPEVQFIPSLEEDLARRDFTMNAMVLKGDGKIFDPYGGKIHIHSKEIKTVGMPKDRIQEDPLRMLRAARFAARYDFKIDPNFIGKSRQLDERIYDVSVERWVQELDKLLTSVYVQAGIDALKDMGLLSLIVPELRLIPIYDYDKKVYESADIAWRDLLRGVSDSPKVARYVNSGICERLKFSNERTKIILDS
jgi:poly(A) polymerase